MSDFLIFGCLTISDFLIFGCLTISDFFDCWVKTMMTMIGYEDNDDGHDDDDNDDERGCFMASFSSER